ncbi:MAG TPA: pyruvate, phosphate dikinase [Planctomycetota bacterium]|nr:pyruvate, phosphate dikinase [Planctomycetota bacterium]
MAKYVYFFGGGKAEGKAEMKDLLGGKGANLAEMSNLGLPVPPGFSISTEVCQYFYEHGRQYPPEMQPQIDEDLAKLEQEMGKKFGDPDNPLLVSVRSGAAVSMPGMMDTVLNLGLNDKSVQGLVKMTGNERFAWDAYRRLVNMFGNVVLGLGHEAFEHEMDKLKKRKKAKVDTDLDAAALKELVAIYKNVIKTKGKREFPQDPREQLTLAIDAVFGSWNNPRAIKYREINRIRGLLGTAVNVQTMVFGNLGESSGTGVCFTRDPSTGENVFYGEYLMNAQGEDVVAGIRTPMPISALDEQNPAIYKELEGYRRKLEQHYRDMQDIEFTIENGRLFILQTRKGKRTAAAAVKNAVDMVSEKMVDEQEAVLRIDPYQMEQLLHDRFDPKAKKEKIAKGLPASPGAATGQVVFNAKDAEAMVEKNKSAKVILVRVETSPEDIGGMHVSQGILTARGGMTSHAAVVGRGMGKCCVVGVSALNIDYKARKFTIDGITVKQGQWISLDGTAGEVYLGQVPTIPPSVSGDLATLLGWADANRKLRVRTNADTPGDAKVARGYNAEGIGLCRTEHMFFAPDRIYWMRRMIMANDVKERKAALAKLLPFQRKDFVGIFKAMDGLPVTIRLLDPPLHEFLPQDDATQKAMAAQMQKDGLEITAKDVKAKVAALHELNPMLGLRGCRLGVTLPEVTEMQARAIMEAACECQKKGVSVFPEIMVPLVGTIMEMKLQHDLIKETADQVIEKKGVKVEYKIGTMIEIPRAALVADEIATIAEFFSFGTNDLTQMGFGYSRDDVGTFLPTYISKGILPDDPFQRLDQGGIGQLIKIGVEKGRKTRPDLKIGICGEHGGDPDSVVFCHRVGMNYVSCSPFRVPVARLAAAQAAIKETRTLKVVGEA